MWPFFFVHNPARSASCMGPKWAHPGPMSRLRGGPATPIGAASVAFAQVRADARWIGECMKVPPRSGSSAAPHALSIRRSESSCSAELGQASAAFGPMSAPRSLRADVFRDRLDLVRGASAQVEQFVDRVLGGCEIPAMSGRSPHHVIANVAIGKDGHRSHRACVEQNANISIKRRLIRARRPPPHVVGRLRAGVAHGVVEVVSIRVL